MCGLPDVLYVDHGTDFTSHHLAQTAKYLHFQIIYSTIARPQARGKVERIFGTLNTELLADLPGYLTRGQRHPEPVLTLPELDTAIGEFTETSGWTNSGGWVGILTAIAAWYASFAGVTNFTYGRAMVPVVPLGR